MENTLSRSPAHLDRWAISLCFSSATLMALEALHPESCLWMGLNAEQSFTLSAGFATLSTFLGAFILTKHS